MDFFTFIAEIIKWILGFTIIMFGLMIVLMVVTSKMRDDNPFKRILTALAWRAGASFGLGVIAIPLEPIPGLDAAYDIGAPIVLIYYWFTFFRDAIAAARTSAPLNITPPRA